MIARSLVTTTLFVFSAMYFAAHALPNNMKQRSHDPKGWHRRAQVVSSSYHVKEQDLVFGLGLSTRLEHEGFTAAFFRPDVAIDAMGRVLKVDQDDFSALVEQAYETLNLPTSEAFGNLWSLKQARSDYPIDRLCLASSSSYSSDQYIISVYGHDGPSRELEGPVGGYTVLPKSLDTILTLGKEAREGYVAGKENRAMVEAANAVLRKP